MIQKESAKVMSVRKIKKISSSENVDKDKKGIRTSSSLNGISNGIDNPAFVESKRNINEKGNDEEFMIVINYAHCSSICVCLLYNLFNVIDRGNYFFQ